MKCENLCQFDAISYCKYVYEFVYVTKARVQKLKKHNNKIVAINIIEMEIGKETQASHSEK